MNKKGFTLAELLIVIALIGLFSAIAIPSINNIVEGTKNEKIIDDAKKLISLAEAEIRKNYDMRNSESHIFKMADLNKSGEILNDPDGGKYSNISYVQYENNVSGVKYCISLVGSKRSIGKNNCVMKEELYLKNNIVNKN